MPTITAPVLTIHQPWASAIAYGGKDVENRTYSRNYSGLVFIHSDKKDNYINYYYMQPNGDSTQDYLESIAKEIHGYWNNKNVGIGLNFGKIIAVAEICCNTDIKSDSKWAMDGYFHWLISNVCPIKPIDYKGSQRFHYNRSISLKVEFI